MTGFATVARPYARALFGLAQEKNQTEPWLNSLKELAYVVQQEKVALFIGQPKNSISDKVNILADLADLSNPSLKSFVSVLIAEKRLQLLPEIYKQFQELVLALNHTKQAVIYSAYKLSNVQLKDLTDTLKARFGVHLKAVTKVDPALIGGVRVEVGDQILDLSLQGKLNTLYTAMIN